MHKHLNQEIQALKEELDKREQEVAKFKLLVNSSLSHSTGIQALNGNNYNHNNNNNNSLHHNSGNLNLSNLTASPGNSMVNLSCYSIPPIMNPLDDTLETDSMDRLESWLSIPNKRNIRRHGWKKLYVVLRKGKLFFYNSLRDNRESQEPYMTIDLEYLFIYLFLILPLKLYKRY